MAKNKHPLHGDPAKRPRHGSGKPARWSKGSLPFLLLLSIALGTQTPAGQDARSETMCWFQKARFGMFVHWSISSVAGLEGSWPIMLPGAMPKLGNVTDAEYREFATRFNPLHFDPNRWIRLAEEAGQRYMVFTTKHHDGFCMFDSRYTRYKVTNSPYAKDVLAQLSAACAKAGMPLGLYYSPPDLDHPGYRDISRPAKDNYLGEPHRPEWPLYLAYMELHLEELLTRYGKVPILWFDGFKETPYSPGRLERLMRQLQPQTLINNRLGSTGDFDISENVFPRRIPTRQKPIVQGTPSWIVRSDISDEVPSFEDFRPWEMCLPMNGTWTYNPNDKEFKSSQELIRILVEVTSRGGNFLLNVGPKPDGTIQSEVEERLHDIGRWLKKNGDSIYGTSYGPVQGQSAVRSTANGDRIYLHIFEWPSHGKLVVPRLPQGIKLARLLADQRTIGTRQEGDRTVFHLGTSPPDPWLPVIEVVMQNPWIPTGRTGNRETAPEPQADTLPSMGKGGWSAPIDSSLPNVLLLGDSISIGYTREVRHLMRGRANILRPVQPDKDLPVNCRSTEQGLLQLEEWLGSLKWDLIHFNFGLHDLAYRNPELKTSGQLDKVQGRISVTPAQYEKNLISLVSRLKRTGACLVWAHTTLVPPGEPGRNQGDDRAYNEIAAAIMAQHSIPINDLHEVTAGFPPRLFLAPGNVHFQQEANWILARHVSASIRSVMESCRGSR